MAVAVANPNSIISGNVQIYHGEPDISEPYLGTPFGTSVASTIAGTIVNATLTRGSGHDLWPTGGTSAALDGTAADLEVATGVTISRIFWNSGSDLPLILHRTGTGDFDALLIAGAALNGLSVYITHNNETAEIPFSLANAANSGDSLITFLLVNTGEYARTRRIIDGIRPGNTFAFRIATSGGKEGVVGSNAGWSLLADELYGEDGISMSLAQTVELQRLLRDQLPVRGYRTAEEFSMTYPNLDMTVDTLAFLMNRRSVTSVAASDDRVGYKTAEMERGVDVTYNSLLVQFNSGDFLGGKAQFYLPNTFVTSNIDFSLTKIGSMSTVTFGILRSSQHDSALRYTAQTAART